MFTIVMNKNKELVITKSAVLYQRENLVDKIQILIPQTYNDVALADWIATIKYVDQANIPHAEILVKDEELYKDRLRYVLPVDTSLTKFSGDVIIRITLSKLDLESKKQYVLHTGEATIPIVPLKDYYNFVPDESLEFVDQLVGELTAKIEATDKIAETYNRKKADNLSYVDDKLQLTSNGEKIGDAIDIISCNRDDPDDFLVVEF